MLFFKSAGRLATTVFAMLMVSCAVSGTRLHRGAAAKKHLSEGAKKGRRKRRRMRKKAGSGRSNSGRGERWGTADTRSNSGRGERRGTADTRSSNNKVHQYGSSGRNNNKYTPVLYDSGGNHLKVQPGAAATTTSQGGGTNNAASSWNIEDRNLSTYLISNTVSLHPFRNAFTRTSTRLKPKMGADIEAKRVLGRVNKWIKIIGEKNSKTRQRDDIIRTDFGKSFAEVNTAFIFDGDNDANFTKLIAQLAMTRGRTVVAVKKHTGLLTTDEFHRFWSDLTVTGTGLFLMAYSMYNGVEKTVSSWADCLVVDGTPEGSQTVRDLRKDLRIQEFYDEQFFVLKK